MSPSFLSRNVSRQAGRPETDTSSGPEKPSYFDFAAAARFSMTSFSGCLCAHDSATVSRATTVPFLSRFSHSAECLSSVPT